MNVNRQIDAYREPRGTKQHERELLEIIAEQRAEFKGAMLDVGCAAGSFITLMRDRYSDASYTGFDISPDLVKLARENLPFANCSIEVADALSFSPRCRFDIIVASGVLGIFEDFREPIQKWLSWLNKGGILYIFGRFNSRDIDTIVRYRNNATGGGWEGGLTSYSTCTVGRFLKGLEHSYEFRPFRLNVDIAESNDPIRTWTVTTSNGERLVVNGANALAEHHFLIVCN